MRHTANDKYTRCLECWLNDAKIKGTAAVDTDAGIAYGYAMDSNRILASAEGDAIPVIYRGKVELKYFVGMCLGKENEVESYLAELERTGGTPQAEFDEFTKSWKLLLPTPAL